MSEASNPRRNVFEELGFDKAEAAALLQRSNVMIQLTRHLRALGKTQKELGAVLGIGQSRVSDLLKGKAKLFSLDMLLTLANKSGMVVKIEIESRRVAKEPPTAGPAQKRVVRAVATVPAWAVEHRRATWYEMAMAKWYGASGTVSLYGSSQKSDSTEVGKVLRSSSSNTFSHVAANTPTAPRNSSLSASIEMRAD